MQAWQEVAAELLAYRQELERAWGGVDDALLARYLANACDAEERRRVEELMAAKPAVAQMTRLVREALGPVWKPIAAAEAAGKALPGGGLARALSERLRAWIGQAGELIAAGVESCLRETPSLAWDSALSEAPSEAPARPRECQWRLPLEEAAGALEIAARAPTGAGPWLLRFTLRDANPGAAAAARLCLGPPGDLPLVDARFETLADKPLEVAEGEHELVFTVGQKTFAVTMLIGGPGDIDEQNPGEQNPGEGNPGEGNSAS